jgi:hypothetical protein
MRRRSAWLLTFCIATGSLPAAVEPQVADLRMVVEARPADFTFTWSDPRSGGSGADAFDTAWAAGAGLRWGFGGAGRPLQLLTGVAALVVSESQGDLDRNGILLRAEAGWCYGLDERWLLSLTAETGLGRSTARLRTGAGPDLELSGTGWEVGTRAGVRYSLDRRWSIGLEAGWISARDRLDGDDAELAMQRSGLVAALAIAWTIAPQPRPLGGR